MRTANSTNKRNRANSVNSSFFKNRRTGRTGANTVQWSLFWGVSGGRGHCRARFLKEPGLDIITKNLKIPSEKCSISMIRRGNRNNIGKIFYLATGEMLYPITISGEI